MVSMPQFDFKSLLWGLVCCLLILFTLAPLFFRNVRWVRLFGYFMAVAQILNAAGHTWGTIAGQTVASVRFPRPAPGFYSSSLLLNHCAASESRSLCYAPAFEVQHCTTWMRYIPRFQNLMAL